METLLASVRLPQSGQNPPSLSGLSFRFKPELTGFTPVYQNVTDLAAMAGEGGYGILEKLRTFCGCRQILWGPAYTETSERPLIRLEFASGAERDHYQAAYGVLAAGISKDEWRFPRPDSSFRLHGRPEGDTALDLDGGNLAYAAPLMTLLECLAQKLGVEALQGVTIRDASRIEFHHEPDRTGAAKPALIGVDFSAAGTSSGAWRALGALAIDAMTFEFFTTLLRDRFLSPRLEGEKPVEADPGYRDYWRRNEKDLLIPRAALDEFLLTTR